MIRLIAFDLDGVLIDVKDIHKDSLNLALAEVGKEFIISDEEHLSVFDGLPTTKKLQLLTKTRNLPTDRYSDIWNAKQKLTLKMMKERLQQDDRLVEIFKALKEDGLQICVASNSIRETIKIALLRTGLMEYIDFYVSNQDVKHPKPHPEIYLKSMITAEVSPKETVVVEDSSVGQQAAVASGAHLCSVRNSDDVTLAGMRDVIAKANDGLAAVKWSDRTLNVLIPMAGHGSRFEKAGYTFPKPLIDVMGKPMIQMVVENLNIDARYIYVVRKEHYEKYNLQYMLNLLTPGCDIVVTDGVTDGAACTALLAKDLIDCDSPLLMANSDQYVEWNSSEFMYSMSNSDADGGILTFTAISPKWSFVRKNESGLVVEVAEKKPISDIATCGVYWFRHGSEFVAAAEQMIRKNIRVNNEFYVCPIFNELILDGKKIRTHHIEKMWGTGTPEDLNAFVAAHEQT